MTPNEEQAILLPDRSPFAYGPDGQMVDVYSVANGKACACNCVICRGPLVARQGNVRAWHFAHMGNQEEDCRWATETALHMAAKNILSEASALFLPELRITESGMANNGQVVTRSRTVESLWLPLEQVELEKKVNTIKPDVICRSGERNLLIEITVTHGLDRTKREKLKVLGIDAIEINLRNFREQLTLAALRRIVLEDSPLKNWAFLSSEAAICKQLEFEVNAEVMELNAQAAQQTIQFEQAGNALLVGDGRLPYQPPPRPEEQGVRYDLTDGASVLISSRPNDNGEHVVLVTPPENIADLTGGILCDATSDGRCLIDKSSLPSLMIYLGRNSIRVRS